MKKYIKPVFDVEKFTVADVITDSETTTTPNIENDVDDNLGFDAAGLEINDEF